MPQSLAKNLVHLIYSSKNRTPCLHRKIQEGLFAYQAGILKEWGSPALVLRYPLLTRNWHTCRRHPPLLREPPRPSRPAPPPLEIINPFA